VGLHLHLNHLQGTPQHAAKYIRIPKLVLRSAIVGKLHEIGKGIVVDNQGELVVVARPVGNLWCDVQEYLESNLSKQGQRRIHPLVTGPDAYLRYHVGCFAEVGATLHGIRLGKIILNQPQANVIAHLIQLPVDLGIVVLVVFAQLCDDGAIGQGDQLSIDLVDASSIMPVCELRFGFFVYDFDSLPDPVQELAGPRRSGKLERTDSSPTRDALLEAISSGISDDESVNQLSDHNDSIRVLGGIRGISSSPNSLWREIRPGCCSWR
jgi:hypothetical protein